MKTPRPCLVRVALSASLTLRCKGSAEPHLWFCRCPYGKPPRRAGFPLQPFYRSSTWAYRFALSPYKVVGGEAGGGNRSNSHPQTKRPAGKEGQSP